MESIKMIDTIYWVINALIELANALIELAMEKQIDIAISLVASVIGGIISGRMLQNWLKKQTKPVRERSYDAIAQIVCSVALDLNILLDDICADQTKTLDKFKSDIKTHFREDTKGNMIGINKTTATTLNDLAGWVETITTTCGYYNVSDKTTQINRARMFRTYNRIISRKLDLIQTVYFQNISTVLGTNQDIWIALIEWTKAKLNYQDALDEVNRNWNEKTDEPNVLACIAFPYALNGLIKILKNNAWIYGNIWDDMSNTPAKASLWEEASSLLKQKMHAIRSLLKLNK
jgi:hypothetical protein